MLEFVQRRSRLNLLHYTQKKHDNLLIISNTSKNKIPVNEPLLSKVSGLQSATLLIDKLLNWYFSRICPDFKDRLKSVPK